MIQKSTPVPVPATGNAADPPSISWRRRLRGFGYVGQAHASVYDRLTAPFPAPQPRQRPWPQLRDPLGLSPAQARRAGWGWPLLVAFFAGLPRFWHLGSPRAVVFDETYYAKDGWSLLRLGYEGTWPDRKIADPQIMADPQVIPLSDTGSFVAHPPTGKWVIAVGEWMFGLTPFGWRFMTAVLGTLSVLMLCRAGRRLFRSTLLGCLAGALMAVDGLHYVMSRTALLDLVVMFFVLAAFASLLIDRDHARARLAAALPVDEDGRVRPDAHTGDHAGTGVRPWRAAAGLFLGLAASTKWNGLYFLVLFVVLTLLWDVGSRRVAGARHPYRAVLRRDLGRSVLTVVPVAVMAYLATWTGWFLSDDGYGRHWADGRGGVWSWIPAPLRSLWHYESGVYRFNIGLHIPHKYESNPWSWLIQGRPVLFHYQSPKPGTDGCRTATDCSQAVLALGTPLLWWAACCALVYLLYRWALRRDWRAGAILCAVGAGYLPWFLYQDRTIFSFYAIVFVPYLCLAVTMMLGALLGPPGATEKRRVRGTVAAGVLVLLIAWNFVYFFPIYSGQTIPYADWHARMWLDTWI
ncbi:dolichyl-phosphate-mannose--protein mannosyltransferase [Streptomyces sp. WI04-05B]|uniref:dolichyl-phosphate-mannose--protein mannosyltransferase n=1 Tax=Streptomyces TaxID=1883 RepID=UPI0029A876D3|nr:MULTISPECIES: phospholipid carrier-dependent glycosyltransferase [unclassified Streptomyces]MDX2546452.1 phospholipid carrier-dependent glycosyltransferase [Streptomyces sp. WI04-05B]MDX2586187.1 phospholipid carrier-dependent glycosyltransferase [Streptomyces sp. WI04-05A]MDX3748838.1 phospholipid carrier-dependent glycosyltransferase [Streptomyces sp. AK08-02]